MKNHLVDLRIERLRRLPAGDDVWQLAVRPGPQWVVPEGDEEGEDAAFAHWKEMLELNPGDNQGVRHTVIPRLLERGRDEEASALLAAYADEEAAMMRYAAALAAFRRHGKGAESNRRLAEALRANPHAVKYLLDADNLPPEFPHSYRFGSEEEAILLADNLVDAWRATPGALDWLRGQRREAKKLRERRRKGR